MVYQIEINRNIEIWEMYSYAYLELLLSPEKGWYDVGSFLCSFKKARPREVNSIACLTR